MFVIFSLNTIKSEVFEQVKNFILENNITIESTDSNRPWGGFYVISESSLLSFIELFFPDQEIDLSDTNVKLKPKILIIAPQARLSWQYHYRRSELWKVLKGPVGAVLNNSDEQTEIKTYNENDLIEVKTEERHRLVGLESWGIVAEIWRHTDITNLSTEDDIVRVSDDFGR
jgi:mannose-6-phosphate isomerase-like protein (cupin superfamily)